MSMLFYVYGQRDQSRGCPKKPMTIKIPGASGPYAVRLAYTDRLDEDETKESGLEYIGCYTPDALRQIRAEKPVEKKPRNPIFYAPAKV